MPEVQIEIGGRSYTVACQDGEETYLRGAAKMLDTEATVVLGQIGRMPSDRMLLMAGLMLADKTAAQEDELKSLQAKIAAQEKALRSAEERLADRARRIAELQEAGPAHRTARQRHRRAGGTGRPRRGAGRRTGGPGTS
jgi:cell division protein ZapA